MTTPRDIAKPPAKRGNSDSQPRMHVGFYSPDLPDSGVSNGIVTYTRIMRDALRALGHAVTVVTTSKIEHADGSVAELPETNPIIRRMQLMVEDRRQPDGADRWVRYLVKSAFHAARRAGVEVFEIEESFGWAGRIAGQGIPIIERLHGPHLFGREPIETETQRKLGDLREAAEEASFTRVQAITSPSSGMLRALTEHYDLTVPVARAVPNPIAAAPPRETWQLKRAVPDQLLCVGRFDLRKGADIVLKAFAEALRNRPSLKLVMVGPDTGVMNEDGRRMHYDEFVAKELSREARCRVEFLGQLPPQMLMKLRLDSALAIVGSRFENFPYSIAEAMAVGMPVLTTATYGGDELVRDGHEGRVVPIGDSGAMSDAILDMLSDDDRLQRMGEAAFKRVVDWLSPERVALETLDVYREAVARN